MIKKKSEYGIVVNCDILDILDNPTKSAPLVCQLKVGDKVRIISKPNKYFYGVGISNTVVGFASREYIKVE